MLTSIVYFYILLFFITRIVPGQLDCSCTLPDSDFATDVNLIYYKCNNETPATMSYPITAPEDLINVLDKNKTTIFYVFGYMQYPEHPIVKLMTDALCDRREDVNVVILDWSRYSGANFTALYTTVFQNSVKVGRLFAKSIQILRDCGLDESKIYLNGFSLGAHIAGFVGKCTNFTVSRITGLDPANPLLYPFSLCVLSSTDALWVDVIHTDMGGYGAFSNSFMATAEFFANTGARPQPNCTLSNIPLSFADLCSHRRAVQVFVISIYYPNELIATQCSNFDFYNRNLCKNNSKSVVGYNASNVKGSYYFKSPTGY